MPLRMAKSKSARTSSAVLSVNPSQPSAMAPTFSPVRPSMRYSILFQFHEFVLLRAQPDRFAVFQRVDAVARLHAFDQVHLARVGDA